MEPHFQNTRCKNIPTLHRYRDFRVGYFNLANLAVITIFRYFPVAAKLFAFIHLPTKHNAEASNNREHQVSHDYTV